MYYVYILLCDKAFFYVGVTINVKKRFIEHKNGYSPHKKRYRDIELVYSEVYPSRVQAKKREEQILGTGWEIYLQILSTKITNGRYRFLYYQKDRFFYQNIPRPVSPSADRDRFW